MEKKFAIYLDALPNEYEVHLDDESSNGTMDQQAAQSAALAEAYAKGTVAGEPVTEDTEIGGIAHPGYQDNSKYYKELAEASKDAAALSAGSATQAKTDAQAAKAAAQAAETNAHMWADGSTSSEDQPSATNNASVYRIENQEHGR